MVIGMVGNVFRYKQTVVLRTDLNMSVGKLVSQACHASLESSEIARAKNRDIWEKWRREGAKKVILKVDSLEDLLKLEKKAKKLGAPCCLIEDRGLTEIPPSTLTALAIGPASSDIINKITGHLKLL